MAVTPYKTNADENLAREEFAYIVGENADWFSFCSKWCFFIIIKAKEIFWRKIICPPPVTVSPVTPVTGSNTWYHI